MNISKLSLPERRTFFDCGWGRAVTHVDAPKTHYRLGRHLYLNGGIQISISGAPACEPAVRSLSVFEPPIRSRASYGRSF